MGFRSLFPLGLSSPPSVASVLQPLQGGILRLALQLYESPGGEMLADFSDATVCDLETFEHGFRSLVCFVEMPLELAFHFSERARGKWLTLNYGPGIVWEGRVEDPNIIVTEEESGLEIEALGSWRALYDAPYTAAWSLSGVSRWRVVTEEDSSGRVPGKFETDQNNRLRVALKKNIAYSLNDQGSWMLQMPHNGREQVVSVSFDYEFNMSSSFTARLTAVNEGFASETAEWTLVGTGSVQSGPRRIVLSAAKDFVVFEVLVTTANTFTGETGNDYLRLTNVRVVTTTANAVNTIFSSGITAGADVVVTPASMANIYVGQSLIINQTGSSRERVTVTAVTATTFTATFANSHSAAEAIEADVVYADEIVSDLVAFSSDLNSNQLASSTALIESPGLDLQDEVYEDAWPADIATKLAALGDNQDPPRLWEVGVWEGQRLHFRPQGSSGQQWAVDAEEMEVNATLDSLRNSTYAVFKDANGEPRRTAVSDDVTSQTRNGLVRRAAVRARTTSETQAEKHRDARLADGKVAKPPGRLEPEYLLDSFGATAPKWLARAGATMNVRNLPPTLGQEIDRIRTFRLEETAYDAVADDLQPVPEEPPASLDVLVARRAEGF